MHEAYFFEQQDGSRIAYNILEPQKLDDIKKTPLVLIMGIYGVKEIFMGLKEELAKNQKVIVFDNRGMGESSVVSQYDPISLDLMAQDTIALIKHLGIKRFNLLGWSSGGNIAIHIASNLPLDLELEKLIICASRVQSMVPSYFECLYNLPKPPDGPKNIQEQKDKFMRIYNESFIDYMVKHPDIFDKYAEIHVTSNCPFEIFKRQWEAIKETNILSKSKTINVPTLLIHGEDDVLVPIENSKLLAREITNSKFISIPKAGHTFWFGASESITFINEFLST
ncbi:Alpha/Beta hydrolase protein [Gigaspora rosea]|uniref:Alpha/Beta hydrolase protein n=1 Tax=Gigaspora rosea TaxID=44941 RepID=A0A397UB48_9GLOM|nr:Alpha/Beta hydrolase protein [Gigaspora rosea]